jgi:hypothetical protein
MEKGEWTTNGHPEEKGEKYSLNPACKSLVTNK